MKNWEAALPHQAALLQWYLLGEQRVLFQNDSNTEGGLRLL